jgi:hypothetical protein
MIIESVNARISSLKLIALKFSMTGSIALTRQERSVEAVQCYGCEAWRGRINHLQRKLSRMDKVLSDEIRRLMSEMKIITEGDQW